jgi:hypothetical protein
MPACNSGVDSGVNTSKSSETAELRTSTQNSVKRFGKFLVLDSANNKKVYIS